MLFSAFYEALRHVVAKSPVQNPLLVFLILYLVYYTAWAVYYIFFHPLRDYPGPIVSRFSRIPQAIVLWNGSEHKWRYEHHRKYGPIVRLGPNSLSFADPKAWADIHGFKKNTPVKDMDSYQPAANNMRSMFSEPDDEKHRYQRKIFTHAFSDRALKEQEPLFTKYIDVLVERIKRTIESNPAGSFDIVKLFNFTTFDIMADLCFGESLGLLQSADYSPWVSMLLGAFKVGSRMRAVSFFQPFRFLLKNLKFKRIEAIRNENFQFSVERVNKRLATNISRPDIWGLVLAHQEKGEGLSLGLMHANAGLFMGAGTETTATELSGLMYYLMRNPECMARLAAELRAAFPTERDITMERAAQLPYLHACLEEGLRIYPPVPASLPRVVPPGGSVILDRVVPAGTHVSMPQYAMYRLYFADPASFRPERWLPDAPREFADDVRSALQPFSHGPRNCLGKNMAYHEMRMVLVRLVWGFEWELAEGMDGWAENQRSFAVWEKGPMWVRARVRART
ncbi:uncharacterized protein PV09_05118 [Verruconis gallopava]|uniref:Cytochrome P450 n=1 Tax=Verruconis gallopava TaxID=253628 RepID=A0A0D2AAL5_9PEZI|nr:uncharacterized protein PV09_05118 [Verruconis gallopava]KIW03818.1 hypothetical protein PV09_05118 [Verruconis gallopava]